MKRPQRGVTAFTFTQSHTAAIARNMNAFMMRCGRSSRFRD